MPHLNLPITSPFLPLSFPPAHPYPPQHHPDLGSSQGGAFDVECMPVVKINLLIDVIIAISSARVGNSSRGRRWSVGEAGAGSGGLIDMLLCRKEIMRG